MVRTLREIIQELCEPRQEQFNQEYSEKRLHLLAAEALSATLDEKLTRAGSLQHLTEQLAEIIELFPTGFPLDDLCYRLAHLYMRLGNWEKADYQLLALGDSYYYSTEARIYSALCAVKLGSKEPLITEIAERLRQSPSGKGNTWKTRSIQEQHYNLLEMLVYAAGIEHKVLAPYYEAGSTQADLQVKSSFPEYQFWIPIARFRLHQLLQHSQGFLILDFSKDRMLREFETKLSPPVRELAEKLAREYPSWVEKPSLEEELKDYYTGKSSNQHTRSCKQQRTETPEEPERRNATLSEWKRKLCEALNDPDAISICDVYDPNERTKYRLEHPFLLIN